MEYFLVRYDSRVVNYERKMFIRLATGHHEKQIKLVRYLVERTDKTSRV